jgi:hypothetical protein
LQERDSVVQQGVVERQQGREREKEERIRRRQAEMESDRQAREQAMENVRARMEARVRGRASSLEEVCVCVAGVETKRLQASWGKL